MPDHTNTELLRVQEALQTKELSRMRIRFVRRLVSQHKPTAFPRQRPPQLASGGQLPIMIVKAIFRLRVGPFTIQAIAGPCQLKPMVKIQFVVSRGLWMGCGDVVVAEGSVDDDASVTDVRKSVLGRTEYIFARDCELYVRRRSCWRPFWWSAFEEVTRECDTLVGKLGARQAGKLSVPLRFWVVGGEDSCTCVVS